MTRTADGRLVSMTPKMASLARTIVSQLHMVLKTLRLYDPSNRALLVGVENLTQTINTLRAALGGTVRLQFVGGIVYLNDLTVRIDQATREQALQLAQEFEARQLGGICFQRAVDFASLRDFLVIFCAPVSTEADIENLRASLAELKDLAIELLGPKPIDDDAVLRIDRKTFAIQTYAKAVIAAREFANALAAERNPLQSRLHIVHVVQDLVDVATERFNFLLKLAALKQAHEFAFNHAANMCVLSIAIGSAIGVKRTDLVDLGTSALLADLGADPEDGRHHEASIRQISTIIGDESLYPALIRRMLVSYESRGTAEGAHLFSRIVRIASVFDRLTTSIGDQDGCTADEALRIMLAEEGQYDPVLLRVLVNLLGVYPVGTAVKLESGEIGIAYHTPSDASSLHRPWIKVIVDARGQKMKRPLVRNLAQVSGPGGRIVQTLRRSQLPPGVDPAIVILF